MKDKKSITFYFEAYDCIRSMSTDNKGKLLEALFEYAIYGVEPELDEGLIIAFNFIARQHDRDAEKYRQTCEKNKINSNKRFEPPISIDNHRRRSTSNDIYKDKDKDKDKDIRVSPKGDKAHKDTSLQTLVNIFIKEASGAGRTYTPIWGRDCKLMRDLVAGGATSEEIGTAARAFWANEHKFKGNYDVPSFFKAFNRLKGQKVLVIAPPPPPLPNVTEEQRVANLKRVKELIGNMGKGVADEET